jgi:hypothetical protein
MYEKDENKRFLTTDIQMDTDKNQARPGSLLNFPISEN